MNFGAIYDAANGGEDPLTGEGRAAAADPPPYKPCWDIHEGVPVPPWWTSSSEVWNKYDEARGPVILGAAYQSLVTGEDVVVDGHNLGPVLKAEDITAPGAPGVSPIDMIKRDNENGDER